MSQSRISDILITESKEIEAKLDFALFHFESVIAKHDPVALEKLINDLTNYPYNYLIRMCQKDAKFEKFCRTDSVLKSKLSAKLNAAKHPSLDLKTMDGKNEYQVFDLYLAASFMNKFTTNYSAPERSAALNYACDLGLNDALLIRCLTKDKAIKSGSSQENKNEAMASLLADTKQLANIYWGLGYIQAGSILNALSADFKEAGDEGHAKTFLEYSVKNFVCASLLQDNAWSNSVIQNFTKGAGLQDYLKEKKLPFFRFEDAKATFAEWLGKGYETIEAQAKAEIDKISPKSIEERKPRPTI